MPWEKMYHYTGILCSSSLLYIYYVYNVHYTYFISLIFKTESDATKKDEREKNLSRTKEHDGKRKMTDATQRKERPNAKVFGFLRFSKSLSTFMLRLMHFVDDALKMYIFAYINMK